MKHTLAPMLALALLALPLLAEDSPMVAAAKRANRLGKKPVSKIVITNETVKSAGANAHVTTTQDQKAIVLPPQEQVKPTAEEVAAKAAAEKRKAEAQASAAKQQAAEKKIAATRDAAQNVEEEYPDDLDPAQAEKQLQDAQKPPV
jgi:hypothetical protein